MTCTPGEEYEMSRCELPNCPNTDKDVPTVVVDIGDDAGHVLRNACADCLDAE